MDTFALLITIIGGINWLLVGLAKFDLVEWICGGPATIAARIIYTIVGLCSLWCIKLLFNRTPKGTITHN